MTTDEILVALPEGAMLLEPREVFDPCLVGVTSEPNDHWPRTSGVTVVVYDAEKCIEALMVSEGLDEEAAAEWFTVNTEGAWVGEGTPTFYWPGCDDCDEDCSCTCSQSH